MLQIPQYPFYRRKASGEDIFYHCGRSHCIPGRMILLFYKADFGEHFLSAAGFNSCVGKQKAELLQRIFRMNGKYMDKFG